MFTLERPGTSVNAATPRTREPTQARSRARVERLLNTADRILATEGYDALTIARLTKRARVPVGTFYQFFAGKDAIVEVLALRYIGETGALIDRLREQVLDLPLGSRLPAAFDAFVEMYRANPAYRAIRAGRHTSRDLHRADQANVNAAVEGIKAMLMSGAPIRDGAELRLVSRTLQRVADALLYHVFEHDPEGDPAVVEEAKTILGVYEKSAVERLSAASGRHVRRR